VRPLMLAALISVSAIGPLSARAAEQPRLVQQDTAAPVEGIDRSEAFAIGAGIVIGAAVASALPLRGALIVGAMAGGIIGAWWYDSGSEFATLQPRVK
jgi:hypothetical protein